MGPRPWIITAAAVLCACTAEKASEQPSVVERDSAGVRIVESHRPSWGGSEGWRIGADPLFVIRASDGGSENRLLDPTSIDIDSRGRIIVGDGNQAGWHAVLVYDSVGHFLFQAGRPGEGPGEFGQLWWAGAYRGDSIVAFDMSGDRTTIFDPEGDFVRLVRMPTLQADAPPRGTYGYTAGMDAAFGDGSLLAYPFGHLNIEHGAGPAWYEHLLVRLSPDGESWGS
ncbi:MAG: 6-bladed beta-propeller [Gemmatimonadota bacterium]